MYEIWTYRVDVMTDNDFAGGTALVGFDVEAMDGSIGKVDEATEEAGSSYIVVDTGPWIFGKKVLLPAGVVQSIDIENEVVFVDRTKDEIKDAPEFDESAYRDPEYREAVGLHYAGRGGYTEL